MSWRAAECSRLHCLAGTLGPNRFGGIGHIGAGLNMLGIGTIKTIGIWIGDERHSWHHTPSEMASAKASTKGRFVVFEVVSSPGMTKLHEKKTICLHIVFGKLNDSHYALFRCFRNPLSHLVWRVISQMQGLNLAQQLLLTKQLSIWHRKMCGQEVRTKLLNTTSLLIISDLYCM